MSTIFETLRGTWVLNREIPGFGRFKGQANFTPHGQSRLDYHEEGEFVLLATGARFHAYRDYVYQLSDKTITVFFDERPLRIFLSLVFNEGRACGHHRCGFDDYDVTYQVGDQEFTLTTVVNGPKKDYTISSLFSRS